MAITDQKLTILMAFLTMVAGDSQQALSQDTRAGQYPYYYDGNYVLPVVKVSSYPAGYEKKYYQYNQDNSQNNSIEKTSPRPPDQSAGYSPDQGSPDRQTLSPMSADDAPSGAVPPTLISHDENGAADPAHTRKEARWQPLWGTISEVRLGAALHDIAVVGRRKENGIDLDAELLFASPAILDYIWSPRPTVGIHANITDKNNTSQAYGGLTWEWWPLEPVFINFFFGFSYHNGKKVTSDPRRKELGSLWLFRESLSIGWQTDHGFNISAYLDHASNATLLAKKNEGIDAVGLRLGYRF